MSLEHHTLIFTSSEVPGPEQALLSSILINIEDSTTCILGSHRVNPIELGDLGDCMTLKTYICILKTINTYNY